MLKNGKTCCFTGHRIIPIEDMGEVSEKCKNVVEDLIQNGIVNFISGGALGFDLISASIVIHLRDNSYPHVKLFFVLPCKDQTLNWNEKDIKMYYRLLSKADEIIYISHSYYRGCMHDRNRYMVEQSNICIAYLRSRYGGTAYTVNYAMKQGLRIINLAK